MASVSKADLASTASTGNVTGSWVQLPGPGRVSTVAFQFVVEAVGSTPTVTWKVQGSYDGLTGFDVLYLTDATDTASAAAVTVTGTGTVVHFLNKGTGSSRSYPFYRVVTTSNTNVTFRCEMWTYSEDR
jgi:hypothetical protein